MVETSPERIGLSDGEARRWRQSVAITIAAGVVRLVVGALTPLFPDETYYWDWSRHLAAGYFDHPPAIAWTIGAGALVGGATPFGVRLGAIVLGTIAGLFLVASARRLAGSTAARLAAIIFALMPLSAAGLVLATPDAPLFAFAAGCTYCLLRALETRAGGRESLAWWCAAGAFLGIAVGSKYTAVLLPLGVVVALGIVRELRPHLRTPSPWLATAIALAAFSPVVAWNATHDWASFAFQVQHGLGAVGGSMVKRELDMLGGQAGLVTPILFVMIVIATVNALRRSPAATGAGWIVPSRAFLAIMLAFIFLFFIYSATKRRVEANWPALAYIPGILLLVSHAGGPRWGKWMRAGIGLAGLLTAVTYVNTFTPILPVPARRDPVARSAGWEDLARAVNRLYEPRLSISSYRTWVGGDRYQETSQLAFQLPDHPQTFSMNLATRANQYDLWPTYASRAQPRDGLILALDEVDGAHSTIETLRPHFEAVHKDSLVTLARNGDPVKSYRIWLLERWRGTWPGAALRSRP